MFGYVCKCLCASLCVCVCMWLCPAMCLCVPFVCQFTVAHSTADINQIIVCTNAVCAQNCTHHPSNSHLPFSNTSATPPTLPAANIRVCVCVCGQTLAKHIKGLAPVWFCRTLQTDGVLVCPGSDDGNDDKAAAAADDDHGCHDCRCSNINTTYDNSIKSQYITEASVV